MSISRYYKRPMASVEALQYRCNFDETKLRARLLSLDVVPTSVDTLVTEAIYEEKATARGLGNLHIEKFTNQREASAEFKGTAFIVAMPTDVLVFRKAKWFELWRFLKK